jgi:hypothetical protein
MRELNIPQVNVLEDTLLMSPQSPMMQAVIIDIANELISFISEIKQHDQDISSI